MALTPAEKARNKRAKMIEYSKRWGIGTHSSKVATVYQKMIRAEAAALPSGITPAIVKGELTQVCREVGYVVCVTCGKRGFWKGTEPGGGGEIETGHYVGGRTASVLFAAGNAHAQCKSCNRHLGGNQTMYKLWMHEIYGKEETERIELLKWKPRKFTHDELVDLQLGYAARLKAAETAITNHKGVET